MSHSTGNAAISPGTDSAPDYIDYRYAGADAPWDHYLWPAIKTLISERQWADRRAFELGCGNGATANMLSGLGFEVTAIDMSEEGVAIARKHYPHIHAHLGSAYGDLKQQYGTFPLVVSLEVIEHCMYPRLFVKNFLSLIAPGGVGVLSTPYHGYWKNLALAVSGRMDQHFMPLWDGGHIKFFSIPTLRKLLAEQGATDVMFLRAGRIPPLAKSMIAILHSPNRSGGN